MDNILNELGLKTTSKIGKLVQFKFYVAYCLIENNNNEQISIAGLKKKCLYYDYILLEEITKEKLTILSSIIYEHTIKKMHIEYMNFIGIHIDDIDIKKDILFLIPQNVIKLNSPKIIKNLIKKDGEIAIYEHQYKIVFILKKYV